MPNWKKVITSGSDAILNSLSVGDLGVTGSLNVTGSISGNTQDVSDYFIDYTGLGATKFQVGNVNNGTFIFANRFTGDILSYNGLSGTLSINASTRLLTGDLYVGAGTAAIPTIRFNGRTEHRIYTPYNSSAASLILSSTSGNIELDTPLTYLSGSLDVSGSLTANTFSGDGSGITGVISSSYATTASYALGGEGNYSGSFVGNFSGSIDATDFNMSLAEGSGSMIVSSSLLEIDFDTLEVDGNFIVSGSALITGSMGITGGITATIGTGTDNSVVVKNSSNQLVTDEIDSKVWDGNLVDKQGTPVQYQVAIFNDADTLVASSNLTFDGSELGLTGDLNVSGGSLGVGVPANATDGRIDASNDIVAYSSSDKRWKKNIKQIESPLEKLQKLSGVEFDWIEDTELHGNSGNDVGVIAQEVELVLPQAVQTRDSGMKAVRYEKLIPLLIETVKEQQKQIDELKNKIG